jgi:membrane-bound serine protease (ClpP class)
MGWWLAFAVLLYLLFVALLIAEVFIPSGGLLTFCAIACLIAGTYIFFKHSTIAGISAVVLAVILIPTFLTFAYREFPNTTIGKIVTLQPPKRQQGDGIPDTMELKKLMGAVGIVVTPLRPVGMCNFSGQKLECVAESGYVDKGKKVKVINVESTQVTVRIVEES